MSLRLAGKVAFITGSSRGIGWAAARLFASEGASIILNSRSAGIEEQARSLEEEFAVPVIGLVSDVSDPASAKECYRTIFQRFRRLDILVNNAGILRDAYLGMISEDVIRSTFNVNTLGAIFHLQEAARLMSRHEAGSIINVSSIMGRRGNQGQAVYAASKAALIGLTLSAAKELGSKNIRVNAIAPGFIETDMTRNLPAPAVERLRASIQMRRAGQPEDVAKAMLFFASDDSAYVTGQVLAVDGGMIV